jgi:uncharacterized BrkB/YihY/UPF0761 family membrane protein
VNKVEQGSLNNSGDSATDLDQAPASHTVAPRSIDPTLTIVLLSVGLAATALVVIQAVIWRWNFGPTVDWARPATLIPQVVLFVAACGICAWRLAAGRSAWWLAVIFGAVAAACFWIVESMAIIALPCPSFC